MRTYLIVAFIGLGLGLAVIFPEVIGWQPGNFQNKNVRIMGGCIIILIACYNFARWYGLWSASERRQNEQETLDQLRRRNAKETPPSQSDPNFDFRDPPGR
jgi:hypothetical protein